MLIAALQEMGKFNKNELEYEPTEEEKTMYSDKEALTNLVNSSLDLQSLQLESRVSNICTPQLTSYRRMMLPNMSKDGLN